MRISLYQFFLLVMCGTITHAHDTYAQEVLNQPISVVGSQVELREVIAQIEQQANVRFVYSTKINFRQRVTVNARRIRLSMILDEILDPIAVSYEVINDRILLKKRKAAQSFIPLQEPVAASAPAFDRIVRGTVVTSENNLPLAGVSVLLKGTSKGTATDATGAYQITIPDDNAVLVYSFVGFLSQEVPVGNQSVLNMALKPDTKALDEVVVGAMAPRKKET